MGALLHFNLRRGNCEHAAVHNHSSGPILRSGGLADCRASHDQGGAQDHMRTLPRGSHSGHVDIREFVKKYSGLLRFQWVGAVTLTATAFRPSWFLSAAALQSPKGELRACSSAWPFFWPNPPVGWV